MPDTGTDTTLISSPEALVLNKIVQAVIDRDLEQIGDRVLIRKQPWIDDAPVPCCIVSLVKTEENVTGGPVNMKRKAYLYSLGFARASNLDNQGNIDVQWSWTNWCSRYFSGPKAFQIDSNDGYVVSITTVDADKHIDAAFRAGYDAQFVVVRVEVDQTFLNP